MGLLLPRIVLVMEEASLRLISLDSGFARRLDHRRPVRGQRPRPSALLAALGPMDDDRSGRHRLGVALAQRARRQVLRAQPTPWALLPGAQSLQAGRELHGASFRQAARSTRAYAAIN